MSAWGFPCLRFGVSPRNRQRYISGSGSHSWPGSGRSLSNWVVGQSMTWLTWTPGLMSISTEGGPERRLNGP